MSELVENVAIPVLPDWCTGFRVYVNHIVMTDEPRASVFLYAQDRDCVVYTRAEGEGDTWVEALENAVRGDEPATGEPGERGT